MCCAYSGRIAAAYRMGGVKVDPSGDSGSNRRVNLCVSIYECESTGGSDWKLEDTIELRDIDVSQPQVSFDLSYLSDLVDSMYPDNDPGSATAPTLIPSPSTLQSIKKSLTEVELNRRREAVKQRHVVQLDWVGTEDGSHILTVSVGSKVILYSAVCKALMQKNPATSKKNPNLHKRPAR